MSDEYTIDWMRAEIERLRARVEDAEAKQKIDQAQCDEMTEQAGTMAMEITSLLARVADLERELRLANAEVRATTLAQVEAEMRLAEMTKSRDQWKQKWIDLECHRAACCVDNEERCKRLEEASVYERGLTNSLRAENERFKALLGEAMVNALSTKLDVTNVCVPYGWRERVRAALGVEVEP